jgi:hypothetical protein
MSFGLDRERRLRRVLSDAGWTAIRASKGPVDLVCCQAVLTDDGPLSEVRFVQVKGSARGPYHAFGPQDRAILRELARGCGATAWLIWWPPRRGWQWIGQSEWP